MKQLKFLAVTIAVALSFNGLQAQDNQQVAKTDSFKVWGNCGMCKRTIEGSLKTEGVVKAEWNRITKIITVSYDPAKIGLDDIQKKIAAVGYDNEKYKGDDKAYENLPGCCHYERKAAEMKVEKSNQ